MTPASHQNGPLCVRARPAIQIRRIARYRRMTLQRQRPRGTRGARPEHIRSGVEEAGAPPRPPWPRCPRHTRHRRRSTRGPRAHARALEPASLATYITDRTALIWASRPAPPPNARARRGRERTRECTAPQCAQSQRRLALLCALRARRCPTRALAPMRSCRRWRCLFGSSLLPTPSSLSSRFCFFSAQCVWFGFF